MEPQGTPSSSPHRYELPLRSSYNRLSATRCQGHFASAEDDHYQHIDLVVAVRLGAVTACCR
jgi:hypothetical protein